MLSLPFAAVSKAERATSRFMGRLKSSLSFFITMVPFSAKKIKSSLYLSKIFRREKYCRPLAGANITPRFFSSAKIWPNSSGKLPFSSKSVPSMSEVMSFIIKTPVLYLRFARSL